jgi:hypothetical protein
MIRLILLAARSNFLTMFLSAPLYLRCFPGLFEFLAVIMSTYAEPFPVNILKFFTDRFWIKNLNAQ